MASSKHLEYGLPTVRQFGFKSSPHDYTLFIWKTTQGYTLLLLYVDDMIIIVMIYKAFLISNFS